MCDSNFNAFVYIVSRNCLIGASYHIKISDCAMFRPVYSGDYFRDVENDHQGDVLPLRWIPWEVYIMVSLWRQESLLQYVATLCIASLLVCAYTFLD